MSWLKLGSIFLISPWLSRFQSLCQDQTPARPQEPQQGGRPVARIGSCLSSALGLINRLLLGKNKAACGEALGVRKGRTNTCRCCCCCCCCCGRDVSTSERDLLVSPQGMEGKRKLRLKISSRDSCAFTLPWLTSFHPTAVTSFGGIGRPLEKQLGVGSALFSSPRPSLFLTPCLQPDVLTASLLPTLVFTLVLIQQFNSGSWSSWNIQQGKKEVSNQNISTAFEHKKNPS